MPERPPPRRPSGEHRADDEDFPWISPGGGAGSTRRAPAPRPELIASLRMRFPHRLGLSRPSGARLGVIGLFDHADLRQPEPGPDARQAAADRRRRVECRDDRAMHRVDAARLHGSDRIPVRCDGGDRTHGRGRRDPGAARLWLRIARARAAGARARGGDFGAHGLAADRRRAQHAARAARGLDRDDHARFDDRGRVCGSASVIYVRNRDGETGSRAS